MCCSAHTSHRNLINLTSAETNITTSLNLGHSCRGGRSLNRNGRYVFPVIIMWDCGWYCTWLLTASTHHCPSIRVSGFCKIISRRFLPWSHKTLFLNLWGSVQPTSWRNNGKDNGKIFTCISDRSCLRETTIEAFKCWSSDRAENWSSPQFICKFSFHEQYVWNKRLRQWHHQFAKTTQHQQHS